jgi:Uma2 family endonuclease
MSERAPSRMTSDAFIDWAMNRPEGEKYELYRGEIIQMAPERSLHSEVKARFVQRILNAVDASHLPCQVFSDSMAVEVDKETIYEPDVVLRCGPRLPPNTTKLTDPLVVIEVLSLSTRNRDLTEKLSDYLRMTSLRHYLVVNAERRTVIHHERAPSGTIVTHIRIDQPIHLDPPGIEIADFFPKD